MIDGGRPDLAPSSPRLRRTAAEWLALFVLVVLTVQYSWLIDDSFVYFRFVDNALYAGRGLVYNAGEYVEGFSSPLWMLTLLVARAVGSGWWLAVRVLGVLSCVAFWALLVRVNRHVAPQGVAPFSLPLLLLATNYAVLCYFTSGVETPLVQVMAAVFALVVFRPQDRWPQLAAGLGPLVRPELAVPWLLLVAWCGWRTRRVPWALLLSTLLTTGTWIALRIWYYAELLPNTFYLKNVNLLRQGVVYLLDTANAYGLHWLLGAAATGFGLLAWSDRAAARRGFARPPLHLPERVVLICLAASVTAFVVKIGGDSRHYRYLAFPVCLAVAATAGLPEHLVARIRWRVPRVAPVVAALLVMGAVFTRYPRQLDRHPILGTLGSPIQVVRPDKGPSRRPVLINDAAAHRHHPDLACPPWGGCDKVDRKTSYREAAVSAAQPPHRGLVVDFWCAGLYGRAQERAIHSLGLTEPFLARAKVPHDRPGHKWDLVPMARAIGHIELAADNRPRIGSFRRAVESGIAPPWVSANLASIEVIERKVFNRHRFFENLRLALTFPEPIDPRKGARRGAARRERRQHPVLMGRHPADGG
ncbi:MAG: hypothetical protein ACRD2Z_12455 [Thermoanaerobaculia bacterium]